MYHGTQEACPDGAITLSIHHTVDLESTTEISLREQPFSQLFHRRSLQPRQSPSTTRWRSCAVNNEERGWLSTSCQKLSRSFRCWLTPLTATKKGLRFSYTANKTPVPREQELAQPSLWERLVTLSGVLWSVVRESLLNMKSNTFNWINYIKSKGNKYS